MANVDLRDEGGVGRDCLAELAAYGVLVVDGSAILDGRGQHVARAQLRGGHPERTLLRWRGAVMAGPADVEVEVVMDDRTPVLRLIRRRMPGVALLSVLDGRDAPVGRVTDSAPMTDEILRLRDASGLVGPMRRLGETWEQDLVGRRRAVGDPPDGCIAAVEDAQ